MYMDLHKIFLLEEIKEVVWNSDGDKSLGPYDYSMSFFKNCCDIIEMEVVGFVNDFYENNRLLKAITDTFIALIPKSTNPQSLEEYMSICLAGSL